MPRILLVIALVAGMVTPAVGQKAEIEAVNAKWIELFNKGDFASVASLYTEDAMAFPPGSASDPKVTTLDVKPLGPSTAREIGTLSLKTKGPTPQEVNGKYVVIWEKIGSEWKLAVDIWNDGK